MDKELYIGIMSGTSLDGVDIAICAIDSSSCELVASATFPFEESLKNRIISLIDGATTVKEVGEIDYILGKEFAKGVNSLLQDVKIEANEIKAIGSHGQTVWHEPKGEFPFTMQLGNPSLLAVETGIDVVSDFRSKDVALGGEGAPFAPAFHKELFSHINRCGVVNIGGMANISLFSPTIIGYDCGCGNMLMDLWINEVKGLAFDRDGAWAKSGKVHQPLLDKMLEDDYFKLSYPKSTGREYFNKDFLRKNLEHFCKIADNDIQATLLTFTVQSIANEIRKFDIDTLLVCGGGAKNGYLMEKLQQELSHISVERTESHGVSSEYMEAMIFAWLAYKRLRNEKIDLKTVTGAKNNTILGGIYASD